MPAPFPTDGLQMLRQLVKDVDLLKRTGAGNRSLGADAGVDGETITIPQANVTEGAVFYQDVEMDEFAAVVGQQFFDGETILTDAELWVVLPSPPICSTDEAVVNVEWDGYGPGGEAIPSNFIRVAVHRSLDPLFDADPLVTQVGVMTLPGVLVFSDQIVDTSYYYRFVLHTADGRRSQQSDTGVGVAVPATVDQDVIDSIVDEAVGEANAYTDSVLVGAGGNLIHYSTSDPGTTANSVGDIWFQRSAVDGSILAQWFGVGGTTWDQTTLSHEVISSVDLGTATVGKLSADYIDTGTLSAEVAVTGTLIAGNPTGGHLVFDAEGLRQYVNATDLVINFSNDPLIPAQFEGAVIADAMTVINNFTLQGIDNIISPAATLRLSAGAVAPASPISLAVGYATYDTRRFVAGSLYIPIGIHGNVDDTADIYSALTFYGYGKMIGPTGRYYTFPERTDSAGTKRGTWGAFTSSVMIHTAAGAERLLAVGLKTVNNGDVAAPRLGVFDPSTMTNTGTAPPVEKVNLTVKGDDYTYETRLGRVFSGVGSTTLKERVAVGALRYLTHDIELKQWTVTDTGFTLAGTTIIVANPLVTDEKFIGVTCGATDKMAFPGTVQTIWLVHGSVKTYAYTSAGVRLPDYDFPTPAGAVRMFAYGNVATNEFLGFRSSVWADTTVVTKLTNNHWASTTSDKWWVSYTWFDSNITGGTHETTQSARSVLTMKKRAGITYNIPIYPDRPFPTTTDDVIAARVYLGRSASVADADPTRTGMERVAELTSPNRSGFIGNWTFPTVPTPTPPPLTNNFPVTSPGKITSSDGAAWVLVGDGSAVIGRMTVAADGATSLDYLDSLFMGTTASSTVRTAEWRAMAASGANTYRARHYLYDGTTVRGMAVVLMENNIEVVRSQLTPNNGLEVRVPGGSTASLRSDGIISDGMRVIEFRYSDTTGLPWASTSAGATGVRGGNGTFVAPPSGVITVGWWALMESRIAGAFIATQAIIRTGSTVGSGTAVGGTYTGNESALVYVPTLTSAYRERTFSGLTPGATYNVQQIVVTSDATAGATFYRGVVTVRPSP